MSETLPAISGKDLVRLLERMGFVVIRINGSHHRMKHPDNRITTIPVHKNDSIPKGLLRKMLREDLKISVEEFKSWLSTY